MNNKSSSFLRKISLACRNALYVVGVFSFFINILMLTTSIYMLQIYDRVLASRSFDTLIYLTIIALIALMTLALLEVARSHILVHVSYWLDNTLNPPALEKSADEILRGHAYGPQAMRDIATIRQFVSGSAIFVLFDAPWVPIYLVAILYLSPPQCLLAVFGTVVLFSLAIVNEMITRKMLAEANAKAIVAQDYVDTSLRNAEVIQAMGMMKNIIRHWDEKNSIVLKLQTIASNRAAVVLAITKFSRFALQILMLALGAYLVIKNELTGGGMIAATILLSRALAPVEQGVAVWKQMLATRLAYHRLQKHFSVVSRQETKIQLPDPKGEILLDKVSYQIPNTNHFILNNISLHIAPGEMIAIIGPSGAGKSTLARLIVGALKASGGEIRLDGVDVYTWERTDFGRHIGYVPQDIELFNSSIKTNIARLDKVDDGAVIAAAQLTEVHEVILKLPKGYDTKIGDHSFVLSGGQRQRIALARAVYQLPRVIMLDEPNANLDSDGETALLRTLLAIRKQGSTQIIISHKPSIVKHVDRILFIVEGKIKMLGSRDQVLKELQQLSERGKQP
jgi:PrtD family type I secretion system ABC transporter